jgi:nucleoside-diphosphate-sugar epimerase
LKILVTGAGGFLGRHCVAALSQHDVQPVTHKDCDLFDARAVAALMRNVKPTHLLHLAWQTKPGIYWTSPENLAWLRASTVLLEEFSRIGGKRFVGAGTCAEYDWTGDGRCVEATTPLRPATPYGAAKHATQTALAAFAPGLNVSFAWGRIFFPYGPGESPGRLVGAVSRALFDGRPAAITEGNERRDYIYATDVARAFAALVESDAAGAFNIGTGEAVSLRQVVEAIARRIGRPDLLRYGERAKPAGDPDLLVADVTRLRRETGWEPRTSLEQGIAAAVDFWKGKP